MKHISTHKIDSTMTRNDAHTDEAANFNCHICGSTYGESFWTKEMMFGKLDRFKYIDCHKCQCVQLATRPGSMRDYYPDFYYSFSEQQQSFSEQQQQSTESDCVTVRSWLAANRNRAQLFSQKGIWGLIARLRPNPLMQIPREILSVSGLSFESRVLDVGCGSGELLLKLEKLGFKSLQGSDPYLNSARKIGKNVHLRAQSINDIYDSTFDLIMFHHSLEHIPDQWATMRAARRLLAPKGQCLVRIPTSTSNVYQKYGPNWVELDPPRHLFVHSHQSLTLLANDCGFKVHSISCDEDGFGYWGSELYCRGIPLYDSRKRKMITVYEQFSESELKQIQAQAENDNSQLLGGRIVAILR